VLTTDFFTPIVDDPADWGRIAAANALSDVYAMGGRPLFAVNLAAWPGEGLDLAILGQVLRGGAEVAAQAGCFVAGGHTIDDPVPKYGLAVTGLADPTKNTIELPGALLTLFEKRIQGSLFGSGDPFHDIPRMVELYRSGDLKLDELITTTYTLDQINQGYQDLLDGKNVRGVVVYGGS